MNLKLDLTEFSLLRDLIEKECKIALGNEKDYLVENRLARIVAESGSSSYGEFYRKAKDDKSLREKIVDAMTTNETLWFRDESPFVVLREQLLPELSEQLKKGVKKQIRIWSAACSTGQEPYSIAMIVHEFVQKGGPKGLLDGGLSILATDISSSALMMAKLGRYNELAVSRGLPAAYKERYFAFEGRAWAISNDIKKMVHLQRFNLQDSFALLGLFDIVFLRNVAIYFSMDFKKELFGKVARALNPEGCLILGSAESLGGLSEDFAVRQFGRGVFYELTK